MVFDLQWFDRHQRKLLWLCNASVIKHWFRWVLRIHNDVKSWERICQIQPNNHKVFRGIIGDRAYLKADFRTHDKFSKRLYYTFRPMWWVMHYWDLFIADRWQPKWSFGFTTLTTYPDADPETTTCDGYVQGGNSGWDNTWASLHDASSGSTAVTTASYMQSRIESGPSTSKWADLWRIFLLFNTASIDDTATISAATCSLYGNDKNDQLAATPAIALVSSAPASNTNLVIGDYNKLGASDYATRITYANWSDGGYNGLVMNAAGLAAISLTGITKLGARLSYDIDNIAPTWSANKVSNLVMYGAERTGTTQDPKLVVTYTISSGIVAAAMHHLKMMRE